MFDYPPGKAPLAILIMAVVSGALLLTFPAKKTSGNLVVSIFAPTHLTAYEKQLPAFQESHPGTKVDLQYVHPRVAPSKLRAAFASDLPVPDMFEIEINYVGEFFLGPEQDIGFRDLTEKLKQSGLLDKVVRNRFTPYTSRGKIYGIPHDIHPVALAYRRDIFEANGIDAEKLTTWDEFVAAGRQLLKKINAPGQPKHFLLNLSDFRTEEFEILLFQNDGGFFDTNGNLRIDDEQAVKTVAWYIPLVAGPDPVASSLGFSQEIKAAMLDRDYALAFLMPDWDSYFTQIYCPRHTGKMALMPLPAFNPGGRRTSTRGGTMMGFAKKSEKFDQCWDLAMQLYFDVEARAEQFRENNIISPLKESWKHPALAEKNAYWSNQPVGQIYASLAEQTPPQYASPYLKLAKEKLGEALSECSSRYSAETNHEKFEDFVRERLKKAAAEVRAQMAINPYLNSK